MSLKTRMAMVAGLAVALAVVIVAVASYEGTKSSLLDSVDQALAEQAKPFTERGEHVGPPEGRGAPPGFAAGQGAPPPRFGEPAGNVQIIAPGGQVIRPPDEAAGPPVDAEARQIAASGVGRAYSDATVSGTHVRVLTDGIGPRGAVQVARSLEEVDSVLSDQLLLLVLVGAGGILLAAVLSIVVARTALRPIALFTRQTESLTAHPDPSQRLEVSGRDEIARLAQSFNTTLDALEQSVEAQRNLVADASHELRTPIATLRANIQLLRDADRLSPEEQRSLRDDIITELDELTALVADVVELARGTKPTGEPDDVRLDAIVGDVVQRTRRRATDLSFDVELEPTLIEGEPERVGRAVTNLLDNARKWSPPGGNVEVRLADGVLSVRDHGAGFSQEDLPHVFDRFYRAQRARGQPGSGLGLAIVRQAAEAHGGWARASNAEGGGALLRVSFGNSTSELTPGEVGASLS
ncbi:MAG TPA: HAMP domain-containing sensor histidine kinase [Solirubrobacteraceae bacterium]|nr:HAMP domain-containing sensor histidine kinase [Solirubrobacteraceae bacterium]